jgi:uncharacterized protein (DUF2267 family)
MHYGQIVSAVQDKASIPDIIEADRTTRATLTVLGSRLSACPNKHIAHRLPSALASEMHTQGEEPMPQFGIEEFYQRVADRARTSRQETRRRARAVVAVLRDTMAADDFAEIFRQLPGEYVDLLGVRTTGQP